MHCFFFCRNPPPQRVERCPRRLTRLRAKLVLPGRTMTRRVVVQERCGKMAAAGVHCVRGGFLYLPLKPPPKFYLKTVGRLFGPVDTGDICGCYYLSWRLHYKKKHQLIVPTVLAWGWGLFVIANMFIFGALLLWLYCYHFPVVTFCCICFFN